MSISVMKQALDAITNVLAGGDFDNPYADLKEAGAALKQAIAEAEDAVAAEREACAKLCEELGMATNGVYERNHECAKAIRARGDASDISQKCVDETAKDRHKFEEMVKKGTKAWDGTPDDWVDDLRGGAEKREWIGLDPEMMRNTPIEFNRGALWAERWLKEKNT